MLDWIVIDFISNRTMEIKRIEVVMLREYFQLVNFLCCVVMLCGAMLFLLPTASSAAIIEGERMIPVQGNNGMVVTSHFLATESAQKVLKDGGNAIDAAVTAAFLLAVTQPRSGNIGGGGFMLISLEEQDEVVAIDYREKAPGKASVDMFLNKEGNVNNQISIYSHLAAGVPGTVAGLILALEKYGTINLEEALAPAIHYAEEGFVVTPHFSKGLKENKQRLRRWSSTSRIFYKADGSYYEPGELFVNKDLATTLKRIATNGAREFYEGKTAEMLVSEMERHGGMITLEDMKHYAPVIRTPVHGFYRGYDVYSMPPPSSGGVHVIQMLNILEGYPVADYGHNSARNIQFMAEAMKRAFAERSRYLGDADFVRVPLEALTSKAYAVSLRKDIARDKATPKSSVRPGNIVPYESNETTHFSIVDKFGNAVSNTYTINFSYGSGVVVEGAGFLLNNEMDDFSVKPGVPNEFDLIGDEANSIAPGKRPLSSMTPSFLESDRGVAIVGTPGGSRIITMVLLAALDWQKGASANDMVSMKRFHHQYLPDAVNYEPGAFTDAELAELESMGHKLAPSKRPFGNMNVVTWDTATGEVESATDPRGEGEGRVY